MADALPDGWGLLLMDRLFRQQGRNPAAMSPLDQLAFIHDRAIGVLTFETTQRLDPTREDVHMLQLAQQTQAVVNGRDSEALRQLALMGGSPHGARLEVLVHYEPDSGIVSTLSFRGSTPWLVKFQPQNEPKEVCAIEMLYAQMARDIGLEMPTTYHFDLDKKLAGFGIERFDVEGGLRVPMLTLAGLLHADFRLRSPVDDVTVPACAAVPNSQPGGNRQGPMSAPRSTWL